MAVQAEVVVAAAAIKGRKAMAVEVEAQVEVVVTAAAERGRGILAISPISRNVSSHSSSRRNPRSPISRTLPPERSARDS
jgi:hypothetical protein